MSDCSFQIGSHETVDYWLLAFLIFCEAEVLSKLGGWDVVLSPKKVTGGDMSNNIA